jgi:hypothetical protein
MRPPPDNGVLRSNSFANLHTFKSKLWFFSCFYMLTLFEDQEMWYLYLYRARMCILFREKRWCEARVMKFVMVREGI